METVSQGKEGPSSRFRNNPAKSTVTAGIMALARNPLPAAPPNVGGKEDVEGRKDARKSRSKTALF